MSTRSALRFMAELSARSMRLPLFGFVTLAILIATELPGQAQAQAGDDSSSTFAGGPLLAGATAGTPEGGSLAIAGALASADPSTGIAHSSFSFRLETARGKVQPRLGLTYSSADGQREAGVGWGLNIASIERRNVAGGPKYANDPPAGGAVTATTDRFVFGGSPLVPICRIETGHCEGALQGEAMPTWAQNGWNYFRLEVDTTYERFFWSPDHKTWVVQTKTGETREYGVPTFGSTSESGIDKDSAATARCSNCFFRWNLVRRYDAMGNANEVVYVWQRLSDSISGASLIGSLTDIYDTSLPTAPSDLQTFAHHTQLVWQADPAAVPSNLQARVFRALPIFRLAQVNVWSMGQNSGSRGLVRSYALAYYAPGTQSVNYGRSLLQSVQMTGACPNVADTGNLQALTLSCATLPATQFTYNSATVPSSWSTMSNTVVANSAFVDLDGDGYPDAVTAQFTSLTNGPQFARNVHGTGFGQTSGLPFFHTDGTGPSTNWFAANTNGIPGFSFGNWAQVSGPGTDGFYDSTFDHGGTPSGFYVPQNYHGSLSLIDTVYGPARTPPQNPWCATNNTDSRGNVMSGVADLDGDGIPDCWSIAATATAPSFGVYFGLTKVDANGSVHPFADSAAYPVLILPNFVPAWNLRATNYPYTNNFTPLLVDVTGDGIPDLVWLWTKTVDSNGSPATTSYISVSVGSGDGTFGNGFTVPMPACPGGGQWPNTCTVALIDLNGDGFADFVGLNSLGTTVILSSGVTSNSIKWGQTLSFPAPPFANAAAVYGPEAADLNASGIVDLLFVSVATVTTADQPGFSPGTVAYLDLLNGEPPPLLNSVSNGLGATTTLTYASTASLGFDAASSGHPWGNNSTQSMHVVTSITTVLAGNEAGGGPFITSYEYHGASSDQYAGAMYDKRFRQFNGFGFVRTKLTNRSNPDSYDVTDTYYEPSLSSVTESPDVPWDALRGSAVFSTRYAMTEDAAVTAPLSSSHTTYKISKLYTGIDGRIVRQVVPEVADTWVYDSAKPSLSGSTTFPALQDIDDVSGGAVSVSNTRTYQPLPWPSSHAQSTVSVDVFGNVIAVNDSGILGKDQVIARSWKWSPVDNLWNWRQTHSSVKYANGGTDRQYDYVYNPAGQLTKITGNLSGTLAIRSDASLAPVHASPQSDPAMVLAEMTYDPHFGNLIAVDSGSGLRNMAYQYDVAYQQLLASESVNTGGSRSKTLTKYFTYDRGFEEPTQIIDVNSSPTKLQYDIFGRITAVNLPDPATPGAADSQSDVTVTYADIPNGPYQRADIQRYLGKVAEGNVLVLQTAHQSVYTDAIGNTAAVLSSGGAEDPPGQWIVSGITQRDSRGEVIKSYESFFAALTNGLPDTAPARLPANAKYHSYLRDSFERLIESHDLGGELLAKTVYHDFAQDIYDANDVGSGAATPTYLSVSLDGHGRLISANQRTANGGGLNGTSPDTLITAATYLATGEVSSLTRSSAVKGRLYDRWMQYDSLGRMVLNVEPNTSSGYTSQPGRNGSVPAGLKSWMYAYDAIGDLVGTTDARGCGVNYTYDGAGRETSEDYIPCTSYQPPHTPVDLSTGVGAEIFNVYDSPDLGDNGSGPASAFFMGKLGATYSSGDHTQYAYDGRGRVTMISRQMPKPPGASTSPSPEGAPNPLLAPYAPTWYQMAISYDQGDRPIAQSTGAGVSGLMGTAVNVEGAASGGTSVITTSYDLRNIPTLVSGSYGTIAFGERRDPDGRLLARSYGDLAGTTATFSYDSRERLQKAIVSRATAPSLWSTAKPGYPAPNGISFTSFTTPLTLQNLAYDYDAVNNPTMIGDARNPAEWPSNVVGPLTAALGYDDLSRLTSVALAYAPLTSIAQLAPFTSNDPPPIGYILPANRAQSQAFGYDPLSNLTSFTDDANALLQRSAGTATYGSANSGGVVGPNQLALGKSANAAYVTTYDAAGNLTSIVANLPGVFTDLENHENKLSLTLAYQWDEAGHLQQAVRTEFKFGPVIYDHAPSSTVTNNYLYDGRGARTWHSSDDSGSTRYFLEVFPSLRVNNTNWDIHEIPCALHPTCPPAYYSDYDLTDSTEQVYLVSGGSLYGRLLCDSTLPSPSQKPLHTFIEIADPHGSTSSAIDKETGELVEQITYLANGQTETDYRPQRWNSFRETYRYTGKSDDYEVGLVYYGARYFVPGLGRWASPDPLTIHALGSDLNPYSFVRGSPYRLVDLSGLNDDPSTETCFEQEACEQSNQTCDEDECTDADANGPGPWANGYVTGGPYIPPPPPPTPDLIHNLVSTTPADQSVSPNYTGHEPTFSNIPGNNPRELNVRFCNSMYSQDCKGEELGFVFPISWNGVFGLVGKEFESKPGPFKGGLFLVPGLDFENGWYVSGVGEGSFKLGRGMESTGVEKQFWSQNGQSIPDEDFSDYHVSFGKGAGFGVMKPAGSNNIFMPYGTFPLPWGLEGGIGVDVGIRKQWGWGHVVDGVWQPGQ